MRTIERSTAFKRDYKREAKGQYRTILDAELEVVLTVLANDRPLEPQSRDHDLSGEWRRLATESAASRRIYYRNIATGRKPIEAGPSRVAQQTFRVNEKGVGFGE